MTKVELRVFVASPGGLDDERNAVEQIAAELNAKLGDQLNVVITVRRFEQLSARPGRPQGQINQWIEDCDVLIAIVHRRWGSPSGNSDHTGFSEEFDLAIERYESTGHPVVSLHFKAVDPESEADAGPQLEQVLAFRRRIEVDHVAMYRRFDSIDSFKLSTMQLLVEEMHSVSVVADSPDAGSLSSAPADESVSVATDTSDNADQSGIAQVLESFSSVIQKQKFDEVLDFDRLMLFASAVSRDPVVPSVHLLNRMFERTGSPEFSGLEINIWFRAYVADHGGSQKVDLRVIPFALVVGKEKIKAMLLDHASEILASDLQQLQSGYLRLIAAYRLRPDLLWSDIGAPEHWNRLAQNGLGADVVNYWATVGVTTDAGMATRLAQSEDPDGAKLGLALLPLHDSKQVSDATIAIDARLILSPRVNTRMGDKFLANASTEVLTELLKKQYINKDILHVVVDELARRDAWPREVISQLIEEDRISKILDNTWQTRARELLFRTADSATQAILIEEAKKSKQTDLILAKLAAENRDFRLKYRQHAPRYLDSGNFIEYFAFHGSDPSLKSQALEVIGGKFEPVNRYLRKLEEDGARSEIIEFASERIIVSAFKYLARFKKKLPQSVHELLLSLVDSSSLFRFDFLAVLEEVATDDDIPTILSNKAARWRDNKYRLKQLMSKATLERLLELLDFDDSSVIIAALEELVSRNYSPSRSTLSGLLRHQDALVRMSALNILATQIEDPEEFIRFYQEDESKYYYNVVCELDRISAGCPSVYE